MRLVDRDGLTELASDDDGGPGFAALLEWTAPASGVYFLEVDGVGQRFGSYELSLSVIEDHGDDATQATATTDPSSNFGVIATPSDTDWFSFEASAGVLYRLTTVLGELSGSKLRLLDADGQTVLATGAEDAAAAAIEWTAQQTGKLFVEVSARADAEPGSYFLQITGDDDYGDNPQNATSMLVPGDKDGVIERIDDRDWFSFGSVTGLPYHFEVTATVGATAVIRLYEGDGSTVIAEGRSSDGAAAAIDWTAAQSATYFLEVFEEHAVGDSSSTTLPLTMEYTLHGVIVGRIPGDYNGDANVDGHDFLEWQVNLGSTENLSADGDLDGVVGASDLTIWRERFGLLLGGPAAAGSIASVEQPTTAASGGALAGTTGRRPDGTEGWLAGEGLSRSFVQRPSHTAILFALAESRLDEAGARDEAFNHWSGEARVESFPTAASGLRKLLKSSDKDAELEDEAVGSPDRFDVVMNELRERGLAESVQFRGLSY